MPKDQQNGRGTRLLTSWIAGFLEHTQKIQSTENFRLWAGIGTLAGALERKVWFRSQGRALFPNQYIFLVGPPASGKTNALIEGLYFWRGLPDHHIAETNLTKAALVDTLNEAKRTIYFPTEEQFNSLLIASEELGALLPGYEPDFMNTLTTLYDGNAYTERRRHREEQIAIDRPHVNIIACCTPGYLVETMPLGAWDQGFLSRVIIVFDDIVNYVPFNLANEEEETEEETDLSKALMHDLRVIGEMAGRISFRPEAARMLDYWHVVEKEEPKPSHPRLVFYNGRRGVHILKLCVIAAADAGRMVVEPEDVRVAMDWLTAAEGRMPDVFKTMSFGGDARVIDECWHFIMTQTLRGGKGGVPVHEVYRFISARTSANNVDKIFNTMLISKLINCRQIENVTVVVALSR